MTSSPLAILDRLCAGAQLSEAEFEELIGHEAQLGLEARARAGELAVRRFGRAVHFRAIVEFTSHCRQDCRYCGLRRENSQARRYRMDEEAILACCQKAHSLGI
ncbi:MAG: hypothetical protein IKT16_03070, partial [Desulfovibrio sp.]|nr:hypothetical protein [Desulfovibrio sp.]